jgi:hypothetical protein
MLLTVITGCYFILLRRYYLNIYSFYVAFMSSSIKEFHRQHYCNQSCGVEVGVGILGGVGVGKNVLTPTPNSI